MDKNDLYRIKHLAGIKEAINIDDVEDDDTFSRTYALEKKISRIILQVFNKIGISVIESDDSFGVSLNDNDRYKYQVSFDFDSNEGYVYIDECTASQVVALMNSGLAPDYAFYARTNGTISVTFKVNQNIVNGAAKLDT